MGDFDGVVSRGHRVLPKLAMRTPLSSEPILDWGTMFGLLGWSSLFALLLVGLVAFSLNL
jgi:hypothetical protein